MPDWQMSPSARYKIPVASPHDLGCAMSAAAHRFRFADLNGSRSFPFVPRIIRPAEVHDRDTVAIARGLLGKMLVTRLADGSRLARRITEVEAYDGPRDRACHASRGRTKRTAVMFEPGGVWYVYLVYGMHEMLNLVTGHRDYPAAVLIRGVEAVNGPGRVTRAFGINRRFNGAPCARASGLWIEDDGFAPPALEVAATPRIGIDYAGSPWVQKPWRFVWVPLPASDHGNDRHVARGYKKRSRDGDQ